MALLVLVLVVFGLFVLQRFGIWRDHPLTWDLTWRILLNILTLLGVLTVLVTLWSVAIVAFHLDDRVMVLRTVYPPISLALTVVLALGLIGVWRRRKWAAWLVLARLVLSIGLQVFAFRAQGWDMFHGHTAGDHLGFDAASLVLWAWAFNRTWKHFGHSDYGKHAKQRQAEVDFNETESNTI